MSASSPRILGLPPFKIALIFEIVSNLASLPILFFSPSTALNLVLSNPSRDVNPSLETHTQLFGALVLALTIPLVLSYRSPAPGPAGERQRGFRVASYITLGAGESLLGVAFTVQLWLARKGIDVGWSPTALLLASGCMAFYGGMRIVFLGLKKGWLEDDATGTSQGLWDGKDRKKEL